MKRYHLNLTDGQGSFWDVAVCDSPGIALSLRDLINTQWKPRVDDPLTRMATGKTASVKAVVIPDEHDGNFLEWEDID